MLNSVDWQSIAYNILAWISGLSHGYIPNKLQTQYEKENTDEVIRNTLEFYTKQEIIRSSMVIFSVLVK